MGYQSFAKDSQYDPIALNIAQIIEQDEKVRRNTRKGLQENKDLQSKYNSSYIDAMTLVHGVEEENIKEHQDWFNENAERIHKKEMQHLEIELQDSQIEDATPVLEALTPFLLETGVKVAGMAKKYLDEKHQEKVKKGEDFLKKSKITSKQFKEFEANKKAIIDNSAEGEAIIRRVAKENGVEAKDLHKNLVNVLQRGGVDKAYLLGITAQNTAKGLQSGFVQKIENQELFKTPNGEKKTMQEIEAYGTFAQKKYAYETFANDWMEGSGAHENMSPGYLEEAFKIRDKWIEQRIGLSARKAEEKAHADYGRINGRAFENARYEENGFANRIEHLTKAHNGNRQEALGSFVNELRESDVTVDELDRFVYKQKGSDNKTLDERNNPDNPGWFMREVQKIREEKQEEEIEQADHQEKVALYEADKQLDGFYEYFEELPKDQQLNFLETNQPYIKDVAEFNPQGANELVRKIRLYNQELDSGIEANAPSPLRQETIKAADSHLEALITSNVKVANADDPTTYKDIKGLPGYDQAKRYYEREWSKLFQQGMKATGGDVTGSINHANNEILKNTSVQQALTVTPYMVETKKGKQENKNRRFQNALVISTQHGNSVAEQIKLQADINETLNKGGYPAIQESFKNNEFYGQEAYFKKISERAVNEQPISDLLNQIPPAIQQMVERTEGLTVGQVITDGLEALGLNVPFLDDKLFTSKDKKELEKSGQQMLSRTLSSPGQAKEELGLQGYRPAQVFVASNAQEQADIGTTGVSTGMKDVQGRQIVMQSKGAADSFNRLAAQFQGLSSEITSSQRSLAKNSSLGLASQTSNHLEGSGGGAFDGVGPITEAIVKGNSGEARNWNCFWHVNHYHCDYIGT